MNNTYFGYTRVSTAKQGERSVSLPEQRDAISRCASRSNLTISHWFEERQTAAKKGRPVWSQMLKQLRQGKAKGVVIHKIDRSARNLKDWADLGDLIDQGIEVHFANEALDLHSRGGRLSADIQAVVAADYIRNLREEAKKGIYGRLKQGFYPMRAPMGYLDNGSGKAKTIDPVKGPLIRKAFELYASQRFSLHTLRDELYSRGLRNDKGTKPNVNSLAKMLGNPFYTGIIRIRRNGETFQGNHESLISPKLFKDVQLTLRGKFHSRSQRHEFLFRRLIKCGYCGYTLVGELRKAHVYYRCHTDNCVTNTIREDAAETFVTDAIRKLEFSSAERALLEREIRELKVNWIDQKEQALRNLTIRKEQVTERLTRATNAFLDGILERDLFESHKRELLDERQTIQDNLTKFDSDQTSAPQTLARFLECAGSAWSLYQAADQDEKRLMVRTIGLNLSLRAKTIDFAYRIPFGEVANRPKSVDGGPSLVIARTWRPIIENLLKLFESDCGLAFSY